MAVANTPMNAFDLHALLALRHAVENANVEPVSDEGIVAILRGGDGHLGHVNAIFSDVSLHALLRAGRAHGIGRDAILAAYAAARTTALAANPELDRALKPDW